jgi:hypothetical protein
MRLRHHDGTLWHLPMAALARAGYASTMNALLIIFMVVAVLATLGVLARGIIIMARGKDISGQQSNKMMSYRVAFQALAIAFILILFAINRPG